MGASEVIKILLTVWELFLDVMATPEGQALLSYLESLVPGGETPQQAQARVATPEQRTARKAARRSGSKPA